MTPLEASLARDWWHLVAHRNELRDSGDYVRLQWPLGDLLLYNDAGEVIATDNVCPHRGARFFTDQSGCAPMVCPYHGWRYRDGGIRAARKPEFNPADLQGLDINRRPTAWCGDWLFVGVSPKQTLAQQLGQFADVLAGVSADIERRQDFNAHLWESDWRVAVENALEADHVAMVHPGSLAPMALGEGQFEFEGASSLWRTEVNNESMAKRLSGLRRMFDTPHANEGYINLHVFPFAMIGSTYGYSYSLHIFAPTGEAHRTHFSSRLYGARVMDGKAPLLQGFFEGGAQLNRQVLGEDHAICRRVSSDFDLASPSRVYAASEARLRWFQQALRDAA
jgi:nitrite reductase/ring-hydroxylating ferredoxin subunit